MASNGALRTCEVPAACCWMSVWKVAHFLFLQGKNSQSRLCFKVPRSWWAGGCALCDRRIKMTVHDTRHFRFWDFYGQKKVGLKELACLTRSCPLRRWICFLDRCQNGGALHDVRKSEVDHIRPWRLLCALAEKQIQGVRCHWKESVVRLDTVGRSWTEVSRLPLSPSTEAQMDKALGILEQEKCQFFCFYS